MIVEYSNSEFNSIRSKLSGFGIESVSARDVSCNYDDVTNRTSVTFKYPNDSDTLSDYLSVMILSNDNESDTVKVNIVPTKLSYPYTEISSNVSIEYFVNSTTSDDTTICNVDFQSDDVATDYFGSNDCSVILLKSSVYPGMYRENVNIVTTVSDYYDREGTFDSFNMNFVISLGDNDSENAYDRDTCVYVRAPKRRICPHPDVVNPDGIIKYINTVYSGESNYALLMLNLDENGVPFFDVSVCADDFGFTGFSEAHINSGSITGTELNNYATNSNNAFNAAYNYAATYVSRLNALFPDYVSSFINIVFNENLVYPAKQLELKKNLKLSGNGATLRIYSSSDSEEALFVSKQTNISDLKFENLNLVGRYGFNADVNTDYLSLADEVIYCLENRDEDCDGNHSVYDENDPHYLNHIPTNVYFYNVTIRKFVYGIHLNAKKSFSNTMLNWNFDECDISNVRTGFMLTYCKGFTITNTRISNDYSTEKLHHCIYLSRCCNDITVKNCELSDSFGGAIHQMYNVGTGDGFYCYNDNYMSRNNVYEDITISNCNTGVAIHGESSNIVIKNIEAYNVSRHIQLGHCEDVTVINFKSYDAENPTMSRSFGNGSLNYTLTPNVFAAIHISGPVQANFSDCEFEFKHGLFRTEAMPYGENQTLKMYIDEISKYHPTGNPGEFTRYHSNWFFEDFFFESITFNNCKFISHHIDEITHVGNNTLKCLFEFKNCEFSYELATNMYLFRLGGNANEVSEYYFNACTIKCKQNEINKMSRGYFCWVATGAVACVINCNFIKNLAEDTLNEGFSKIKDHGIVAKSFRLDISDTNTVTVDPDLEIS